jgi:hypothetical protein
MTRCRVAPAPESGALFETAVDDGCGRWRLGVNLAFSEPFLMYPGAFQRLPDIMDRDNVDTGRGRAALGVQDAEV